MTSIATTYLVSWTESAPIDLRKRLTPPWEMGFDARAHHEPVADFDGELDRMLAETPEFEHQPCWPALAGAVERLRAKISAAGLDPALVLECEEWTDVTSIADALALAFGLPAQVGFSFAADADHVKLDYAEAPLWVRLGASGSGIGSVTVRGFELDGARYVGLLLRVGTPRVLALEASDAAMLVTIMGGGENRDPREAIAMIGALGEKAYPELSARLDRRKAGVPDAAAARYRKLGEAVGLSAATLCSSLVELILVHPDQPCTLGLARIQR